VAALVHEERQLVTGGALGDERRQALPDAGAVAADGEPVRRVGHQDAALGALLLRPELVDELDEVEGRRPEWQLPALQADHRGEVPGEESDLVGALTDHLLEAVDAPVPVLREVDEAPCGFAEAAVEKLEGASPLQVLDEKTLVVAADPRDGRRGDREDHRTTHRVPDE